MTISQAPAATQARIAGTALALRTAADLIRRQGWRQDNPANCAPAAELTAEQAISDAAHFDSAASTAA